MPKIDERQVTAFLVNSRCAIELPHEWAKFLTQITGYVFAYQGLMDHGGDDAYHVYHCNAPTDLGLRVSFQNALEHHSAEQVAATIDAGPAVIDTNDELPEYRLLSPGLLDCETCQGSTYHHVERQDPSGDLMVTFEVVCSSCGDPRPSEIEVPIENLEDYYKLVPEQEVEAMRVARAISEPEFSVYVEGPAGLEHFMAQFCANEFPDKECSIATVSDDSSFVGPDGDVIRFGDGHVRVTKTFADGTLQLFAITAEKVTIH